jgi:hypothetical protein
MKNLCETNRHTHLTPTAEHLNFVQYIYFLHPFVYHVTKVHSGAVGTIDYKPILKCLIFGLFYFHSTTCFDLSRSLSGGLHELHISLLNYKTHHPYPLFTSVVSRNSVTQTIHHKNRPGTYTKAEKHTEPLPTRTAILQLYKTKIPYSPTEPRTLCRPITSLHEKELFRVPNKHYNHEANLHYLIPNNLNTPPLHPF